MFLTTASVQDQDGTAVPSWSCTLAVVSAECTVHNSWWWTEELPETCRVSYQNKIGNQCVCWFYCKEIYYDARSYERKISNLSFSVTTLHTTSITTLSYSTASVSHPTPLTAANRFTRIKLSVCNPSYLSPTVSWMHVDSWNLRRTVPNCPQWRQQSLSLLYQQC